MEKQERYEIIIGKLKSNMPFGLFEDGRKCYFQDGAKVSYTDLWKALRELYGEENIHHKRLPEICPDLLWGLSTTAFQGINGGKICRIDSKKTAQETYIPCTALMFPICPLSQEYYAAKYGKGTKDDPYDGKPSQLALLLVQTHRAEDNGPDP